MQPIPYGISQILLPKADLNVLDLSHFFDPKSTKNTTGTRSLSLLLSYPDAELSLNLASIVGESHVTLLQSLLMPSSKEVEKFWARDHVIGKFTGKLPTSTDQKIQEVNYQ